MSYRKKNRFTQGRKGKDTQRAQKEGLKTTFALYAKKLSELCVKKI